MCKRTCDISRIVSQEAAALELWNVRNKRCLIRAKWNTIAARLRSEKNRLMLLRLLPITPPPQAHVYHEVCSHRLARSFAPLLLSTSSHLPLSLSLSYYSSLIPFSIDPPVELHRETLRSSAAGAATTHIFRLLSRHRYQSPCESRLNSDREIPSFETLLSSFSCLFKYFYVCLEE